MQHKQKGITGPNRVIEVARTPKMGYILGENRETREVFCMFQFFVSGRDGCVTKP